MPDISQSSTATTSKSRLVEPDRLGGADVLGRGVLLVESRERTDELHLFRG
jgi:hypothetical protein